MTSIWPGIEIRCNREYSKENVKKSNKSDVPVAKCKIRNTLSMLKSAERMSTNLIWLRMPQKYSKQNNS